MKNRLLFAAIGFMAISSIGYSKADEFKNFKVETKGINIEINSKLELFHIMAYLRAVLKISFHKSPVFYFHFFNFFG